MDFMEWVNIFESFNSISSLCSIFTKSLRWDLVNNLMSFQYSLKIENEE
jgi:hypothetical protein